MITAGLTSALIFYITINRDLGSQVVGIVLSAFAVGSLGGALLAARLAPQARSGPVMLGGAVALGATLVLTRGDAGARDRRSSRLRRRRPQRERPVAYISLRTLLSPDAMLGRVGATARTLSVGLMPVGSLVAGIALDAIGGGPTLTVMGVLLIVAGAGFALLPDVRRARLAA